MCNDSHDKNEPKTAKYTLILLENMDVFEGICLNLLHALKYSKDKMDVTSQKSPPKPSLFGASVEMGNLSLWSATTGLWHLVKCDRQPGDLKQLSAVSSQPRTTTGSLVNPGDGVRSAKILDRCLAKQGFYCHGDTSRLHQFGMLTAFLLPCIFTGS